MQSVAHAQKHVRLHSETEKRDPIIPETAECGFMFTRRSTLRLPPIGTETLETSRCQDHACWLVADCQPPQPHTLQPSWSEAHANGPDFRRHRPQEGRQAGSGGDGEGAQRREVHMVL